MQDDKIKVGAVLVAIQDVPQLLTKGKEYIINYISEHCFIIINDYGNSHMVDNQDLHKFFKFKEEPTENEIKVGDEYVGNTTGGTYTVKEIREDAYRCWNGSEHIWYNSKELNDYFTKKPKPSTKEPIEEVEGFYMVVTTEPLFLFPEKYKSYDDAHKQSMYMSSKQNTTAYVLKAVAQVEQVSKITNFKK